MVQAVVNVAVGVVIRDRSVFVCKRAKDAHQGDLWEFPGGKVESGETDTQALSRELAEEIGIQVKRAVPLMTLRHDYTDKAVCLHVQLVRDFSGEPHGKEGQPSAWRTLDELKPEDFPAANVAIIDKLKQILTN
ncbi:8-oxo-dGTP diphosphatase MutT [Alteromonas sediminis]|uniref:8-oxo-dGTP diphosphatase n=1 Tax=Alteromonas sediminis TaxID=2259342 RepID=A0A3N5Y4U9_9ALTE|nr:8-oxo-dGTP diphosphatase MutT [Alteromonas sediminis]RPJ67956.1 8-oxo-dGTP diphosphatase MutT [Alteromonas sediminis]